MRKMVQTAEVDRDTAIQRSAMVAKHAAQQTSEDIREQLDKLVGLERDHMKLTASHSVAEVTMFNKASHSKHWINMSKCLQRDEFVENLFS